MQTFLQDLPPDHPPPSGGGIARMAADSPQVEERNDVDYRFLDCRSALNRLAAPRPFFEWSLNPYRGCEFGCAYCYARYTHTFMEHQDPVLFERRIYVKRLLAVRLARELSRGVVKPGEVIGLGAATDPYQPAERRHGVTRALLEVIARGHGMRLSITTKSDLVTRDIPLLKRIARRGSVRIHMTVTTTDARLARRLEPRAPTPQARLAALARLRAAGLDAGVNLMPVMPGVNDSGDSIEAVVSAAREAGAAWLHWNTLFLTDLPRRVYLPFIREHLPHAWEQTRLFYEGGSNVPHWYERKLDDIMRGVIERHGFAEGRREAYDAAAFPASLPGQLDLFPPEA